MNYVVMTTLLMSQRIRKRWKPSAPVSLKKRQKPSSGTGPLLFSVVLKPADPVPRRKRFSLTLPVALRPGREHLFVAALVFLGLGILAVSTNLQDRWRYSDFAGVPLPLEVERDLLLLNFLDPVKEDTQVYDGTLPRALEMMSSTPITYTIKRGDTLSEIAKTHNLDIGTLINVNSIKDVRKIIPGMVITIPKINGVIYTVKRGDSLSLIARRQGVSLNDILDANNLSSDTIRPGETLFIPGAKISRYEYDLAMGQLFFYPTQGRLTSPFGYRIDPFTGRRRFHYGVDIANALGTRINAARDGEVISVASNTAYGDYVVIKHDNGFQTLYAHLDGIHIKKGQWVKQGQWIADMGNTGRSTGPHLHFSIYKNNNALDPLHYIQ